MRMQAYRISFLAGMLVLALTFAVQAGEKASPEVLALAKGELAQLGADPVLVEAVKAENSKGKTLDQIKERDKKWMATAGMDDFMRSIQGNAAAKRLLEIQQSAPYFAEIFLTDNQGANVAMTDKTSDYWQGDEAKFSKCFTGDAGTIFVSDVEFDKSAQAYLAQVSVPVLDDGKAIGVLVIGIDVEKLK